MLLFLFRVVLGLSFLSTVRSIPRLIAFEVDDTSPRINYGYEGDWITFTDQPYQMGLFNNTGTTSHIQGALLRFTFLGVGIDYWSSRGPDRGSCRIALNREVMATIPTYASTYQTPSVVWRFSKLAYGMHTIEISVEDATSPNGCELDRFIYYQPDGDVSYFNNSRRIVIGVGVTAAILLLLLGGWVALKRRSRLRKTRLTSYAILRVPLVESGWNRQSFEERRLIGVSTPVRKDLEE